MGVDRGFVIVDANNAEVVALYRAFGAMTSDHHDLLFGLQF